MKQSNKRKKEDSELNIWQPATDLFSALLLILMLVILLLGLYLVHIPEYTLKDPDAGNTYADSNHNDYNTPEPTPFIWMPNAAGGGGDGGGGEGNFNSPDYEVFTSPTLSPTPTISPTPDAPGGGAAGGGGGTGGGEGAGEGPGDEPDAGLKSAVYVMIVDADTNRAIKEANVQFELYGENHALQVLNVYYPKRVSFRSYETDESGTFYLPEKLSLGAYELHQLSEPEGYDVSSNIEFLLDETFDWSDPLVIRVPLYPARNIIRIKMNDADTGAPLSGGIFDVVAAESIITSDGTLRYFQGQSICEIICNEEGIGESEEVYLGNYIIKQRTIPEYYVGMDADIETEVQKRSDVLPAFNTVSSPRTKIRISLKDELYPTRGISGAVFKVAVPGSSTAPVELTTTTSGDILLDTLEKGVTYEITQVESVGNYRINETPYLVQVDATGRIDGETETTLELTNHMIRVSIGITDEFSSMQVSDVNLALFDENDNLIRTWTSTGNPLMFDDLAPGSYYIVKDADTSTHLNIQVQDIAEIQNINLKTSYLFRYFVFGGIAAGVLLVVVVVIIILVRRRKKRKAS